MTVQDLINALMEIEDKSTQVVVWVGHHVPEKATAIAEGWVDRDGFSVDFEVGSDMEACVLVE